MSSITAPGLLYDFFSIIRVHLNLFRIYNIDNAFIISIYSRNVPRKGSRGTGEFDTAAVPGKIPVPTECSVCPGSPAPTSHS